MKTVNENELRERQLQRVRDTFFASVEHAFLSLLAARIGSVDPGKVDDLFCDFVHDVTAELREILDASLSDLVEDEVDKTKD